MNLIYTNIQHLPRKKWGLSMNEYCLCDMIYHLSNNPKYQWCIMPRETMADELGLSKQAILSLIDKMIRKGFIIKDADTKHLKTTDLWYNEFIIYTDGKESLPDTVKKVDHDGKESLPNNNRDNNRDNNLIISNDIIEQSTYGNKEINEMQGLIKQTVENLGLGYKAGKNERQRIKNILTGKEYGELCDKVGMTRQDFMIRIFQLSVKIKFWYGKLYNAETFYSHYIKIYNEGANMAKATTTIII